MRLSLLLLCLLFHEDDPKNRDRQPPFLGPAYRRQIDGPLRSGSFSSQLVQLESWLPLNQLGAPTTPSSGNDCWGYTSPNCREYAIMGTSNGTSFVEITTPENAQVVTYISGPGSIWRDIKVYQHYAYAVSEGGGGIQVFDMSLIDQGTVTLANTITGSGEPKTHNVALNEASGTLYRCGGAGNGLRIYLLTDPLNPQLVGNWSEKYVHDAYIQIMPGGPFMGQEIAFCLAGANGGWDNTGLSIVDVTNKSQPVTLHHYEFPQAQYSHQGWISADGNYFYINDEADEQEYGCTTRTHIIDIHDLLNPVEIGTFSSGTLAIDHNLYVHGDYIFEANYRSGLRLFSAENPAMPVPIGWFDTYPDSDSANFNGLWSTYPYFPSGTVIGSDLERGLFVWHPLIPRFGDVNQDFKVDEQDYRQVLAAWAQVCTSCPEDLDDSGRVDLLDLLTVRKLLAPCL